VPTVPTVPTDTTPVIYNASANASGSVDLCLADGVTNLVVAYSAGAKGSGVTPGDADYAANTGAVTAALADLAAKTPAGATLGACGAPVAQVTPAVVTNAAEAATVPEAATVAVPAAATVPAAVPAGDGSQAPGLPMWALAMIAVGVLGAGFAGKSILAAGK
jgi:hypothetical protein